MTNQAEQGVLYLKKEIIYLEINEFENSNTSKSNEVLQINKLKEVEILPELNVTKLKIPVIQTTPLENMCVLQNRIQYGKRRRILNKILSASYIKKNKNLCTCKVQVKQKHKISHKVLLRRLRILSDSKRNNKLFSERIENVKVFTCIDISSDDLSNEETKENVKRKKKKDTNYIQTSEPYTVVTNNSDDCRTVTFCEEILPTTHHILSDGETIDNVRRKKRKISNYIRTSEPYTYSYESRKKRKNGVTDSSKVCGTVTFCEEILPMTRHVLSGEETVDNVIQTSKPYTAVTDSSEDCRAFTFCEEILPTTHHVLSGEETVDSVIQTSKPYTAVTDSSEDCRAITFCEEILPMTHHVLSDEETIDSVIQTSKPYTAVTDSSEDCRAITFCEEILPTTHHVLSGEETVDSVIQTSKPYTAVTDSSENCRAITFCEEILPMTHHVLSGEETIDSVIQTSKPYTAVTDSSEDCRAITFCEEIFPTTHHVLSGVETVNNVIQTSKPYTAVTDSSEDCGTVTFCDVKLPTLRLKIQDFENKKFRKLLQYMYKKLDLKVIETMSNKEFNVIVIIENENLQLTDIFITDKNNIIIEIATVPFNDYSYIYNLYDESDNSNNLKNICCNVLRLQCCCWHNRQKQIGLKFPKDFKRFLFIPHSCLNSCSCCCNGNGKEFVSEKPKQTNNLSAADITTPTQSFSTIQIPQNTLQAKALSFKKPKYKQRPDSFTKPVQSYSSLSLQFHFETNLKELTIGYKQLVETIYFGSKGEILFHDYNVETNSMCLVRLDIKYVILTQGIITDNICCKYKYEVVLEKLKLVFKIDQNILTYIQNGHKDTLCLHRDICEECKLSNNIQTMDLTKNLQFQHYSKQVNLPIEHTRKAIVNRAVKPKLVMVEQTEHLEQTETLINHVPINIILKTIPRGALSFQVNPNETVNLFMPVHDKSSKATQSKSSQKMKRLNYLETASSCSILQSVLGNKSRDEILLPKIVEVYSLKESNVIEDIDSQVNVKSEIEIEEHEVITGKVIK